MLSLELKKALSNTSLCQVLTSKELEILATYSKVIEFDAGQQILQQGKKNSKMYIILNGKALVTVKILGEGTTNIATVGAGSFLGEISLIEGGVCSASVFAATQMQCLLVTNTLFEMLSLFYSETKYKLILSITHEVFTRLKNLEINIKNFMSKADMAKVPILGEVIHSFAKPKSITFTELGMTSEQLKQSIFFSDLSGEEYESLLNHASLIQVPKHCTLIQANKSDTLLCIVIRGAVQTSILQDNKIAKLSVLSPSNLFASASVIEKDTVDIITYTACEQTILLKMTAGDIAYLQKNNLQLWYKIFNVVCKSFIALECAANKLNIRLNSELYNR